MKKTLKKVKDHADLVKDEGGSNAVLNINEESFRNFKCRKLRQKETEQRIEQLENNVSTIMAMLTEINNKL